MASRIPHHRTALVTGARRGLGRAFALALAEAGIEVIGTVRDVTRSEPLEGVEWLELDLGQPTGVEAFCDRHQTRLEAVDLLINNAGFADFGSAVDFDGAAMRRHFEVLVTGPATLVRACLPAMRQRDRGSIVNVSSLAVDLPIPFLSFYNAGKAALSAYSHSLMLELQGSGVQVVDFRPGDHATEFYGGSVRHGAMDATMEATWEAMRRITAAGPAPSRAARDLLQVLRTGRSGTHTSGSWFQARLAAWAARHLPEAWMRRRILRYYGLKGS